MQGKERVKTFSRVEENDVISSSLSYAKEIPLGF